MLSLVTHSLKSKAQMFLCGYSHFCFPSPKIPSPPKCGNPVIDLFLAIDLGPGTWPWPGHPRHFDLGLTLGRFLFGCLQRAKAQKRLLAMFSARWTRRVEKSNYKREREWRWAAKLSPEVGDQVLNPSSSLGLVASLSWSLTSDKSDSWQ